MELKDFIGRSTVQVEGKDLKFTEGMLFMLYGQEQHLVVIDGKINAAPASYPYEVLSLKQYKASKAVVAELIPIGAKDVEPSVFTFKFTDTITVLVPEALTEELEEKNMESAENPVN